MQENWYELMETVQRKQELERVLACNEKTKSFGLTLTEEDAGRLMASRRDSLRTQMRVEFGKGILPEIIETFCDSPYLQQENYADVIAELQEIFYLYKNESEDNLTDEELLTFMKEQFDGVCYGSVAYLEETCLERFARAIRAGYRDYVEDGGKGEYDKFSQEARWDRDLFLETLFDLLS